MSARSHQPRWHTALRHWVLACLCLLLACAAQASAPAADRIQLRDEVPTQTVWSAVRILPDPERALTVQDVLARAQDFAVPLRDTGTLGVRRDAVWVRVPLTVTPTSDGIWVLDIDYPVLQRLDVYLTADGRVLRQASLGSLQPFTQRPLRSRSHALPFLMKPGQNYELLLRVETSGAMVLPITLQKPPAWHSAALNEQLLQGSLIGLALCLLLYSLGQWFNLREVLFLQYALLITGSTLFSLHLFGLGTQYLWTDNAWFELHVAGLAALMATCGSFLFIGQTLMGQQPASRLLRAMRWGAVLCVVLGMLYALDVLSTRVITAIVSLLGLVPALMGIPGALRRARGRRYWHQPAAGLDALLCRHRGRHRHHPGPCARQFLDSALIPVRRHAGHDALHAGAGPTHTGAAPGGAGGYARARRHALAGTHRPAHRTAQPAGPEHCPDHSPDALHPRQVAGGVCDGPRRLQARERHARPRRG